MTRTSKSRHGQRFHRPSSSCHHRQIRRAVPETAWIIRHRIARRAQSYTVLRSKAPARQHPRADPDGDRAGRRVDHDRDDRPSRYRRSPGKRKQRACILNRSSRCRTIARVAQSRKCDDRHDAEYRQDHTQFNQRRRLTARTRFRRAPTVGIGDHSARCDFAASEPSPFQRPSALFISPFTCTAFQPIRSCLDES